jgi:hypothetical protein
MQSSAQNVGGANRLEAAKIDVPSIEARHHEQHGDCQEC